MESAKRKPRQTSAANKRKFKPHILQAKKFEDSTHFKMLLDKHFMKKATRKNDEIELMFDFIGKKNDNTINTTISHKNNVSSGRRRRPGSKVQKRNTPSISKKKRNSRPSSMRREEIVKNYLGSKLKADFTINPKAKPLGRAHRLNKSYHLPKSSNLSQVPSPTLKYLTKGKKVNNFFSEYVSPERSIKNSPVYQSQKLESTSFGPKKRDSHGSPIILGKPKAESKHPPSFKIIK